MRAGGPSPFPGAARSDPRIRNQEQASAPVYGWYPMESRAPGVCRRSHPGISSSTTQKRWPIPGSAQRRSI